jgi:D-beta-D-heptose 7-phosphate kinase/D-beta-D-heptose 1-phosphate adenosyltransferase
MQELTALREVVEGFSAVRVLLLGDTILDIYTYGSAMGLSAETPTIVARRKEVKYSLGGAALVCRNLLELGAAVQFVTLVGADEEAAHVREFKALRLKLLAVADPARPTTVKHRFWVDGYKLFQLDQRDDKAISQQIAHEVLTQVENALPETDIVVISDYRHGLLSPDLLSKLLPRLHAAGKPVYVDSQVSQNASNHKLYRGGGCVMVLNLKEAQCIDPAFSPALDPQAFGILNRELGTEKIIVKLGSDGAMFQDGSRVTQAPANKVTVTDTTGAGDAFLSAFCLAGTANAEYALRLANAWAGLSVQIHGTIPPKKDDLLQSVKE